jgi:vacuolar protein sorting-associated protein 54
MVEVEQWTPADVGSATQAVVDDIISGAVRDPSTFMLNDSKVAPAAATKPTTAKHLVIEERNYFAVAACLKALETLADYIRVVLNLPLLATDAMSRIIEFAKVCRVPFSHASRAHPPLAIQFADLPSRPRCRRHALGRT